MTSSSKRTAFGAVLLVGALLFSGCANSESSSSSAPAPEDVYPGGTFKDRKTSCTVTGKEAAGATNSDGDFEMRYRIYTEECGTFAVQDDWFIGQFNSADTYGSIAEGKVYDFEAYGWRNGFMSTFPNIKKAYEVKQ